MGQSRESEDKRGVEMILFQPRFIEPILTGQKTQTRRKGKKRWNVGAIHQCKTLLFGEPFARVKILDVRRERLGDISFEDAQREGFLSPVGFSATWIDIHGVFDADEEVWVVEFEALK